MFKYIDDGVSDTVARSAGASMASPCVPLTINGEPAFAREGSTVAMALLQTDIASFRSSKVSGSPRAPLCLMGVCFECLVQVDGRRNVQACMTPVEAGMAIRTEGIVDGDGNGGTV